MQVISRKNLVIYGTKSNENIIITLVYQTNIYLYNSFFAFFADLFFGKNNHVIEIYEVYGFPIIF